VTPITTSGWLCRRRHQAASDHQREKDYAGADSDPRRLALVAREHNENNVDSASPVPEHFSNEPFFDSRDEAAAERLDIRKREFNCTESCPRASRHQRRPRVKRADVGTMNLSAMASKSCVGQCNYSK
jgi:hypothetical protein